MPVAVSYPGVYIQEVPSGVHTITGVSTSVTAFLGRTERGPTDEPITISSFGDFQRFFGGLSADSAISYAIRDFFQNGGSQGVVVRVYRSQLDQATAAVQAVADAVGSATPLAKVVGAAKKAAAAYKSGPAAAAAQAMVQQVTEDAQADGAVLADVQKKVSGAVAEVAAAAVQEYASITVQLPDGLMATLRAAQAVLSQSWTVALDPNPSAGSVADEAAKPVSSYRTRSEAEQTMAKTLAGAASGAVGENATTADVLNAISGAVSGAVANIFKLPDTSEVVTAVSGAFAAAGAGVVAALPGESDATPEEVSTAASGAVSGTGADKAAGQSVADAVSAGAAIDDPAPNAQQTAEAGVDALPSAVSGALSGLPSLVLSAANQGDWANGRVKVVLDTDGITDAVAQRINPTLGAADLFNLSVTYAAPDGTTQAERFLNLSLSDAAGGQRLDRVLATQSNFVRYKPSDETALPPSGSAGVASGGMASDVLDEEHYLGSLAERTGMYALEKYDLFNILCIPPDQPADQEFQWNLYQTAATYCEQRRAFLLIDPPKAWTNSWKQGEIANIAMDPPLGSYGPEGRNAAVFFPHIVSADPLLNGQPRVFPPCGAMAGIFARTDVTRGVWKAPAGVTDGAISGIAGLEAKLSDSDSGHLNPLGINALRTFPVYGSVVWGARTLKGADQLADDYKYIPVRRLALYIEESLYRGTKWAVFEPNDEPLWAQLRLNIGAFMNGLFRKGAFQGSSAKDAYFVKCDGTTTTQNDIDLGQVNVTVGFAPLKPAEFVILSITQIAGQIQT